MNRYARLSFIEFDIIEKIDIFSWGEFNRVERTSCSSITAASDANEITIRISRFPLLIANQSNYHEEE